MKKSGIIILATLLLSILVGAGLFLDILIWAGKPADVEHSAKTVTVESGQRFHAFSEMLHKKGIINHPTKFRWFGRINGYDKRIKAGEYIFSSTMTPKKIFEIIVTGKIHLRRLTIPEGYNLRQVARAVAKAGFGTDADFLKTATDADLAHAKGIDGQTFEGYLFPDTYYFPKNTTPEKIISTMVKRFRSVFKPEWEHRAEALGFTVHQVVTLASIIEKEAGIADERSIISSVFHNRLSKKMRLESDPTVIYGIKDFDGNLTRKHLAELTPYNTYRVTGLPPGPISNTGSKAIEAALYPRDTQFIFFVSKKDNTHQFSTNFKDHNKAVRKYQLGR